MEIHSQDQGPGSTHSSDEARLARARALLARADGERDAGEVLDELAAIIGRRAEPALYQKPFG